MANTGYIADKDLPYKEGYTAGSDDLPAYGRTVDAQREENIWIRLGISPKSFQRRNALDANNQLNHTLKKRHLHMIAIGGSIGAGLFVGSGSALSRGGPGALILDFGIIGIMIFNVGEFRIDVR